MAQITVTYKFLRNEGREGVTSIAIMDVSVREALYDVLGASPAGRDTILSKVTLGITQWMKETAEGYEALASTNNDFNVGGLDEYQRIEELKGYLAQEGITNIAITTYDQGSIVDYDTHLFDWDEVDT